MLDEGLEKDRWIDRLHRTTRKYETGDVSEQYLLRLMALLYACIDFENLLRADVDVLFD